jgi:hypothetical protein
MAFKNCSSLSAVILPDGITSTGAEAFYRCYNLPPSFTIPSNVQSTGESAFRECNTLLTCVTVPDGMTTLETNVFPALY